MKLEAQDKIVRHQHNDTGTGAVYATVVTFFPPLTVNASNARISIVALHYIVIVLGRVPLQSLSLP